MDDLLQCIEDDLEGNLPPEQFSYDFPAIYASYFDDGDLDEKYIDAFDDISEACGWYEPNPLHREDDDEYIGEEELRNKVEEKYQTIKKLSTRST